MPQENKRAIRERMKALKGKSTPELKELYAGEITATDKTAIEKVLRQRGALIPEKSGPVVAAPGDAPPPCKPENNETKGEGK
jgi:hypothetical protein